MRKSVLSLVLSLTAIAILNAQKPVAVKTLSLFNGRQPESFAFFNPAVESKGEYLQYVDNVYQATIKPETLQDFQAKKPGIFRLILPSPFNIELDLYQSTIYSNEARILTSDGAVYLPNPAHLFYRGIIHNNPNSLAIVTIFQDRVQILYADESGNKRIQSTGNGKYILFSDTDILIPRDLDCHVSDDGADIQHAPATTNRSMAGNCVEVYVECDYKSYVDNGSSIPNTEEWVAELWNEVITLYDNEDIPVAVSDIFIYTSSDPFAGLSTTSAVLNAFAIHIDTLTYDGGLAHLLSTRSLGGGIAIVDVLCSNTPCAFSASLSTNIIPFPTYSWSVEVVTHEMGHNMGSWHTHACVWNGNNTALDGCGPAAGYSEGCDAPLPSSGTIMSYCHLVSGVGINFNNGFGTQPGNLIRSKYQNASCNTGSCAPPLCTALTFPVPNSVNVDINNDLSWASASGANGYRLTIGTTPNGSDILNNFDVGPVTTYNPANPFPFSTVIYVKVVPYNELGEATSCAFQSFTTEPNIIPLCTQLSSPQSGTSNVPLDAVLHWPHAVGNQTGYKITIGTTPTGGEIANLLDIGNTTSYDPPGYLPFTSTIYVKITPYHAGGDVGGCSTLSFTTITPVAGDFCSMAINLPCGNSISGNTSLAYPDSEAFFCGTSVDAPGIWFTFVGNGQNTVLSTCAQYGYDIKLNAYSGNCNSLTCVTGNDDYCNTGSLITFPTVNGTTYYILVQGWEGATGTFTLTRTCYSGPFYCTSQGINASLEWIKTVSVAAYTKISGSSTYSDFTNETITLSRGVSHPITISPQFAQGSRNEYYRVWIDFNKDGDFSDAGEQIFAAGPSQSSVTGSVNVPLTASTGITRMRVSMRYNAAPPSCGAFAYGEVEDYSVDIRCNTVTSLTDSGNGSLRNVSMCVDDNEHILFDPSLNNQTIVVTAGPIVVDGLWKWMPGANTNIMIQASGISRIVTVPSGKSLEMQNLLLIGGTATNGSAIDNDGILILKNTDLKRATGTTTTPLWNNGALTILETCELRL